MFLNSLTFHPPHLSSFFCPHHLIASPSGCSAEPRRREDPRSEDGGCSAEQGRFVVPFSCLPLVFLSLSISSWCGLGSVPGARRSVRPREYGAVGVVAARLLIMTNSFFNNNILVCYKNHYSLLFFFACLVCVCSVLLFSRIWQENFKALIKGAHQSFLT